MKLIAVAAMVLSTTAVAQPDNALSPYATY